MSVYDYHLQYCATYSPQLQTIYFQELHHELPPGTLNGNSVSWKFKHLYRRVIPNAYVLKLDNGRVFGKKGAIITKEGILLRDLSREFGKRDVHSVFQKTWIPSPKWLSGNVAVLLTDGGNTYYHWIFDILPRLHLLEKGEILSDIDYFIFPEIIHRFQKESLRLLSIDATRIIEAKPEGFHVEAENLFVPSLPSLLGTVNKWTCVFLREKLVTTGLPEIPSGKKIYISRGKANTRRLINEQDITEMLQNAGFSIIRSEDYSLPEQVAIYREASVVIAPHGSGLSNIVFCKPGTIVIDLFNSDFVIPCFWTIANNCGLKYYFLYDKEKDNATYAPYWEGKGTDFIFPKEKLEQLLNDLDLLK